MSTDDTKELRRRLEALRLKHNDANELSLTHDCLFADLIAVVEILARNAPITDTTKPTKPARAEGDHTHEAGDCTFFSRVEALLVDWEGLLQSTTISEGVRDGVKVCVKGLRKELDK